MKTYPFTPTAQELAALLDDRLTQIRRPVEPQPLGEVISAAPWADGLWRIEHKPASAPVGKYVGIRVRSPLGAVGDEVWAREAWATIPLYDILDCDKLGRTIDLFWEVDGKQTRYHKAEPGRWRPATTMPRWASRITRRVTGVRVERLQDITEDSAIVSGWDSLGNPDWRDGQVLFCSDALRTTGLAA